MSTQSEEERTPLLSRQATTKHDDPLAYSPTRKRWIVTTALLTGFLSTLDLTIVATCIATISSELQSADQEAWIGTAYLWSNVTFTPLYGRLSDLIGRRAAYLQALIIFTVATFFCGFAPNFTTLIIARFVAGMGGGGMGTVSSVLMSDIFTPAERGFYQGISFAVFGAGTGLGGPIGGALTQAFGWRAAFYAQVPVAVISIVLAALSVPKGAKHQTYNKKLLRDIDFGGSFSLLVSIGALLQLLSRSGSNVDIKHDAFSIAMAVIFPVFFLIFIYVELRIATKPVLPLALLKRRAPLCVGIIAALVAIVNFNMMYHLPMIYELVLGQPLAVAGAHMLPNSAAMTVFAPIVGLIVKRTQRYKWLSVICALGPMTSMALILTLSPRSSWAVQWLSVLPMGAGFSGLLILTLSAILNSVEKREFATATGFVFVFRCIGQVFGVGLSGAVFQGSLALELDKRFEDSEIIDRLRHASKAIKTLPEAWQRTVARQAFGVALRNTFIFGLTVASIIFIVSLYLPDHKLEDAPDTTVKAGRNGEDDRLESTTGVE